MTPDQQSKLEALKYGVYVCETRKGKFKYPAYNVACDEIKLFLEAAIERVENGEDMPSYATTQSESKSLDTNL